MQLEREVPQLVEYFNRACDWLRAHHLPVPKIDLMHLFGMELTPSKGNFKLGGFHHDYLGQLEKSGVIRLEATNHLPDGFYKAQVWVAGVPIRERKTFFPQNWTRERVIKCVTETYQNCVKQNIQPKLQRDGKYLLTGKLQDRLNLQFYLDQKMNIKTVYPIIVGETL